MIRVAAFVFLLAAIVRCGAEEPAPHAEIPWGKADDGFVCRITMKSNYCIGEPIEPLFEIKNVSDKERTLLQYLMQDSAYRDPKLAKFAITDPAGRTVRQMGGSGHGDSFAPRSYKPIKPNEVRSRRYPDIRSTFDKGFNQPGEYKLTFHCYGVKPSKAVVAQFADAQGKVTKEYETPTDEQLQLAFGGRLVANTVTFTITAPGKDDLRVHEWGVFTVYTDLTYANAGLKAEWASLPEFFYRQFPTQRLKWVPSAWNKPIIYFYSKRQNLDVGVSVTFTDGAPVVWWPACSVPHDDTGGRRPEDGKKGPLFRSLLWNVSVGSRPARRHDDGPLLVVEDAVEPKEFELPKDCWLIKARAIKDAALVSAAGTNLEGGAPWTAHQTETERFIYYDGLVPAPDFLRCTDAAAASFKLKNNAAFELRHLFVVDRRNEPAGAPVRFAHLPGSLGPGKEVAVPFREIPAAQWPAAGSKEVQAALVSVGLSDAEATSVVEIWRDGFFMSPGVSAFYVLPQAEYDRMLPLSVTPEPAEIVRVGVALHPGIDGEPAAMRRAGDLIAKMESEDFNEREEVSKSLAAIGGVAFHALREAAAKSKNAEVRERCQRILDEVDATQYLEKAAKESGVKR